MRRWASLPDLFSRSWVAAPVAAYLALVAEVEMEVVAVAAALSKASYVRGPGQNNAELALGPMVPP